MIKDELKSIKSDRKDLRNFGLVVGGVFLSIGLYFGCGTNPPGPIHGHRRAAAGPRPGPSDGAEAGPKVLMGLAVVMGFVMNTGDLVRRVFFRHPPMPLGFCLRLAGKRMLDLGFDKSRGSYWITKQKTVFSKERYEKQF